MIDDIVHLIESDLGPPKKKSGRWWFWECPFHPDKHPSLGVSLVEGNWHCFQCGAGGDARAWLWKYRRVKTYQGDKGLIHKNTPNIEKPVCPPNEVWQARAMSFIHKWSINLWSTQCKEIRKYLHGRGLNEEILQKHQIGFNPINSYEPLEKWGLIPATPEETKVFIPAGICIPWIVEGQVWKVNFRRFGSTPKYLQIKGSQSSVFELETIRDHTIVFIVEGEFDAMLLEQEAGDLAGVCTLGSASSRHLSSKWLSYFLGCQRIYLVGDNDKAGCDWAEALSGLSQRLKQIQVPEGKDITESWLKRENLYKWVERNISR